MSKDELRALLQKAVDEHGQATVARMLGYSSSAVSQVLSGKYVGDPTTMLTRVNEVYGHQVVNCPVLGEISLGRCADERKRLPRRTNPQSRILTKTCPECTERMVMI